MQKGIISISEGLLQRRVVNEASTILYSDFYEAWKSASNYEGRLNALVDLLHELENTGAKLSRTEKSDMYRYFSRVCLGSTPATHSIVNQVLNIGDKLGLLSAKNMEKLVKDFKTAKTFNK